MSQIKKHFTSRFPDGYLLEADYSQLEIYVLAYLSGDIQLKADLLNGVDLHSQAAERLFGRNFTAEDRKTAKQLSFQLQYGSGAKAMSIKNGIPISLAKKFIAQYYERYPGVAVYQNKLLEQVKASREVSEERTEGGFPRGVGKYQSETGRIFVFKEYDSPSFMQEKGEYTSFKPTEIKNYGVQGFAGGDIVLTVLGRLFRDLKSKAYNQDVLLINTIHDSILLDIKDVGMMPIAKSLVRYHMQSAPNYLKEDYGIDFDLPLKVEFKAGKNWAEMAPMGN